MSYESNVPTRVKCFYCQKTISREMYGGDEHIVWHKRCRANHLRATRTTNPKTTGGEAG